MALSIKDPEADELARRLAAITGESITEALIVALRERLVRQRGRATGLRLRDELRALRSRCSALPVLDSRSTDEILGFVEGQSARPMPLPSRSSRRPGSLSPNDTDFVASMLPPDLIRPATGWVLTADGHWITKLIGVALLTQAYFAWISRESPHIGVAKGLAAYQIASATVDWVMWLVMLDQGIFNKPLAKITVACAIGSHYLLGLLRVQGIREAADTARGAIALP